MRGFIFFLPILLIGCTSGVYLNPPYVLDRNEFSVEVTSPTVSVGDSLVWESIVVFDGNVGFRYGLGGGFDCGVRAGLSVFGDDVPFVRPSLRYQVGEGNVRGVLAMDLIGALEWDSLSFWVIGCCPSTVIGFGHFYVGLRGPSYTVFHFSSDIELPLSHRPELILGGYWGKKWVFAGEGSLLLAGEGWDDDLDYTLQFGIAVSRRFK